MVMDRDEGSAKREGEGPVYTETSYIQTLKDETASYYYDSGTIF